MNATRQLRIRLDDLPALETLRDEEKARIFGAGRVRLGVEALEDRCLMSANPFAAAVAQDTRNLGSAVQAYVAPHASPQGQFRIHSDLSALNTDVGKLTTAAPNAVSSDLNKVRNDAIALVNACNTFDPFLGNSIRGTIQQVVNQLGRDLTNFGNFSALQSQPVVVASSPTANLLSNTTNANNYYNKVLTAQGYNPNNTGGLIAGADQTYLEQQQRDLQTINSLNPSLGSSTASVLSQIDQNESYALRAVGIG